MKPIFAVGACALALLLAGCGETSNVPSDSGANGSAGNAAHADPAYAASGTVTAVAGDQVTIAHGPVEGLGWPAMTMTFRAAAPELIQGISAGDRISFEFVKADGGYRLTSVTKTP